MAYKFITKPANLTNYKKILKKSSCRTGKETPDFNRGEEAALPPFLKDFA